MGGSQGGGSSAQLNVWAARRPGPLAVIWHHMWCENVQFEKIGDMGIRTPGLTGAIRALYQLSYGPEILQL